MRNKIIKVDTKKNTGVLFSAPPNNKGTSMTRSLISASRSTSTKGSGHLRFDPVGITTQEELCKWITRRPWSPIIWTDGIRAKSNFLVSYYLALDFDDGRWTIDRALTWAVENGYETIIATTKSHQKDKVSPSGVVQPACDRFRVVVPFSRAISDLDEFEYNMREVMKTMPVDPSCRDGGRFYFPCQEIVAAVEGEPFEPVELTADMRREQSEGLARYKAGLLQHKENGTIPTWVMTVLSTPTAEGERHGTAYRMGATLAMCGWTFEAIVSVCRSTNLRDIGEHELKRAISNGYEKALSSVYHNNK